MPFGLQAQSPHLRRRPLAWTALCYAIGGYVGYYAGAPFWVYVLPLCLFVLLLVRRRRVAFLCAAALFFSAGVVSFCAVRPEPIARQDALLRGRICASVQEEKAYSVLLLDDITLDGTVYPHKIRLYLYANDAEIPTLSYGDVVCVSARITPVKSATGFGAYDNAAALWRRGIGQTANASAEEIRLLPAKPSFMRSATLLQETLARRVDRLYPHNAPIVRAILLGDRSNLDNAEYEAYRYAGIVHILAVSGLHISVLAEAVYLLLHRVCRFGRKTAFFCELPLLLLYAAITGFPASVLRAGICFALMQGGVLLGRPRDRLTGLSAAFLLICAINPLSMFDVGFQLSFGAILGLCMLTPVLSRSTTPRWAMRTRLHGAMWRPIWGFWGSLGVLLTTLPICANVFGGVTIASLVTNIIAIPIASAVLPLSLLSLLLSPAAVPTRFLLNLLGRIALWAQSLPIDLDISIPKMSWPFVGLYAGVVILFSAQVRLSNLPRRRRYQSKTIVLVLLAGITFCSCQAALWAPRHEQGLQITFVDVGQGDCALLNCEGTVYMLDTGKGLTARNRIESRALSIEGLFLSHPDIDHTGAAEEVLRKGNVQTLYLPECWQRMEIAPDLAQAVQGASVVYLSAGDVVQLSDNVEARVLHPPLGYVPESDNAASLVLWVCYGDSSALFMGDLSDSDITFSLPDCDVLKLAHHASRYASGAEMLSKTAPSAAIISVGTNNYGHPNDIVLETLERLSIPLFRTDIGGDITARLLPDGNVLVQTYLPTPFPTPPAKETPDA